MITSKATLVEAVYKWLIRDPATEDFINTDLVETYIQIAEAEMNRELKIRDLEKTIDLVTSGTDNFVTLPDDYHGISAAQYYSPPYDLNYSATRRDMYDRYGQTGQAVAYFVNGNKMIFNSQPSAGVKIALDYFGSLDPLLNDDDTNVILTKHPDAYLYGACRQALINLNVENRLEKVGLVYGTTIDRILKDDQNSKIAPGTRMVPPRRIG